ncbi:DUF6940 family protein [Lacipirellula parvula]|uniref:Uncharacterized protein n=1 Tax=Lacipirellula parvula TaxID=2650471 RepID=A0A5K7XD56_9BACT|nr:hypothetical protein PLANPX_1865 [Lacipirellula parvula]
MWSRREESLPEASGVHYEIAFNEQPATFGNVAHAWREDENFRLWFNSLLAASPFTAFRWETPGVCLATLQRPFEFVLLDAPRLARQPDANAFSKHFPSASEGIATFANLGGDAVLVVPTPLTEHNAYGHLAAFVRQAPQRQCHALWQAVGRAMDARLNHQPVWLSTAGAGVSWLHVRLDDAPKYYAHRPYQQASV